MQVHEGDAEYEFELLDNVTAEESNGQTKGQTSAPRPGKVARGAGLLEFGGVLVHQ